MNNKKLNLSALIINIITFALYLVANIVFFYLAYITIIFASAASKSSPLSFSSTFFVVFLALATLFRFILSICSIIFSAKTLNNMKHMDTRFNKNLKVTLILNAIALILGVSSIFIIGIYNIYWDYPLYLLMIISLILMICSIAKTKKADKNQEIKEQNQEIKE